VALGLGCLEFVTMVVAIFSGVAFGYAFLPGHRFPFDALIGLALPVVTIVLGVRTFRGSQNLGGRPADALSAVIAIGIGICALVIIAIFVLAGVIGRFY
jgi:hypothetical protein